MSHGINPETEAALRDLRDGDFELCPRCPLVRKTGQRECRACGREETRRYIAANREQVNARKRARRRNHSATNA